MPYQVFSNSVSAGMNLCVLAGLIKGPAPPTVEFVKTINDLFDSTNGTSRKPYRGKIFHCAAANDSKHFEFWENMLTFLESWKFVDVEKSIPLKNQPRCKSGWTLTLTSLMQLSEELLTQLDYFMAGRCNQDCVENFFSRVRGSGGNRTNPTAYEFQSAYKLASVNMCMTKSKFSNCQPDNDKFMFYMLSSGSKNGTEIESASSFSNIAIADDDDEALYATCIDVLEVPEKNTCAYLAGYLARRVLKSNCNICEELLLDKSKAMAEHTMYLKFKEYEDNNEFGLKYPSNDLLRYIAACMSISETTLPNCLSAPKISENLQNLLSQTQLLNFINCTQHTVTIKSKLVSYATNLFIKMHLREFNKKLASTSTDLKVLQKKLK